MKRSLILTPLALAACSSQPTVKAENASVAEVAAKARNAVRLTPGAWKGTTQVTEMAIPGMPANAMKQALTKTDYSSCLTAKQAERPPAEMFGGRNDGGCRYETFTMTGGKIDAVMVCKPQGGGDMRMTMSGSYAADRYDVATDMRVAMPGGAGGGTMTMKARTSGMRTGECKA